MKCVICKKEFTPKNTKHIYCGDPECDRARRKLNSERGKKRKIMFKAEPKPCVICHKEFIPRSERTVTCGSSKCKVANSKRKAKETKQLDKKFIVAWFN